MEGTARIWFTPQKRAELWERWKNGQCVADIARAEAADGASADGAADAAWQVATLALQSLLGDIRARKIDVVVVYKVDRLTRSLADFAKLVELFEAHGVSFVSVTQRFNTTTSMGRLTLNVLLSF
jgi:DNA invertase Pin-like site-specific DNA recombinase